VDHLQSDLFAPLKKDIKGVDQDGNITGRQFYLADVGSIMGPCAVAPDIGGEKNAFLQVKARKQWATEFISWLRSPHADDQMVDSEQEDEESADEAPNKRSRR
jgi:hypothetical protein